jgi:hypothetical protein
MRKVSTRPLGASDFFFEICTKKSAVVHGMVGNINLETTIGALVVKSHLAYYTWCNFLFQITSRLSQGSNRRSLFRSNSHHTQRSVGNTDFGYRFVSNWVVYCCSNRGHFQILWLLIPDCVWLITYMENNPLKSEKRRNGEL